MKSIATLAAIAFAIAMGTASACEWSTADQSVQSPETTTVATASGPQSTPATSGK